MEVSMRFVHAGQPAPVRVVSAVGRFAAGTLRRARAGRVIAVFQRSFYLETDTDALVCIGDESIGAGPLNVLCCLPVVTGLRPGMGVTIGDYAIAVEEQCRFDLRTADCRSCSVSQLNATALQRGLAELAPLFPLYSVDEGLGVLIPELTGIGKRHYEPNPLLVIARPAITALHHWLGADAEAAPPAEVEKLIGLGPGLTPSGDDYLAGVLMVLHGFGRLERARRLSEWLLPLAKSATGRVSYAHLCCAAEGEGAEVVRHALQALAGDERRDLRVALHALDKHGSTSGWDALAGALGAGIVVA